MKEVTNYMSNKVFVHKDYTNALRQKAEKRKYNNCVQPSVVWSESKNINWKTYCIFCGKFLVVDKKHPGRDIGCHKVGAFYYQISTFYGCGKYHIIRAMIQR